MLHTLILRFKKKKDSRVETLILHACQKDDFDAKTARNRNKTK